LTYSCDPFGRSGRIVSGQVIDSTIRGEKEKKMAKKVRGKKKKARRAYRGIWLNRAVEGHQCATLLRNLCVLAMKSALLILLHPRNLLFQSV
jgi:hypothetical protein